MDVHLIIKRNSNLAISSIYTHTHTLQLIFLNLNKVFFNKDSHFYFRNIYLILK